MSIYYANLDYESPERFDLAKFLDFNDDNFDILNSYFLDEFVKLPYIGSFVISNEELAPDWISKKLYGRHEYWWLLLYYNDIYNYRHLTTGITLKYFSLSDLEALYFKLRSLQVLKNTEVEQTTVSTTTPNVSDKNYVFTQIILSDTWTITHPLKKRPSVTIIVKNNDGDEEVIESNVVYPNGFEESKVIITFTTPKRGKVILN